ncbi:MAG TPA: hypothetical protein EYO01_00335 [Phycisphaerales bacterium]|nr:hypothetical protein [Phycisphaerales bacterium]HIB49874.1 hypothetical protein [Phycisphaerales bacterium]HIO20383.1 hypothetical protein [Phycisphaerales bacterium]HIO53423.1 hypothetical protein [Phycisphaerales bacterium]
MNTANLGFFNWVIITLIRISFVTIPLDCTLKVCQLQVTPSKQYLQEENPKRRQKHSDEQIRL